MSGADGDRSSSRAPPHGLRPLGATCYLSSVLQVLFMTPELHQALDQHQDSLNSTDHALMELFLHLKEAEAETSSITTELHITDVWRQRCAAEHLELLLNRLSPQVSESFRGRLTDRTRCRVGHVIIEDTTDFWTLPVSHCGSVGEGFQKVFQPQSFADVFCPECEFSTDALTCCELARPPQVLVLLLKRFVLGPGGRHYKSHSAVELTETLHTQGASFWLWGVVDHSEGAAGGHYTSRLRRCDDGRWFYFNKSSVHQTAAPTGNRSQTAYLLLYRQTQDGAPPVAAAEDGRSDRRRRGLSVVVTDSEKRRVEDGCRVEVWVEDLTVEVYKYH